jgi:hypothetical protein
MKIIYLWVQDFIDNQKEIEEQLSCELKDLKVKVVLVYEENFVWEMGEK